MDLTAKNCIPCQGGVPLLAPDEAQALLSSVPGWSLTHDHTRLERRFQFANFGQALAFVNQVADISEAEGHHPDVCFGWGYVCVVYYTHKIGGLHENDFVMAAKVNLLGGARS